MPVIQINHQKTYYKDWRPADGITVKDTLVFAHGLGASNNYYTAVIPTLTAAGYRCIAYDLHGCGLSTYSYVEQSIASLAKDAIDLMDALSIKTATFIGHSMSGITGPHLAATYPDRISALILIGPVYPTQETGAVFDDRIKKVSESGMEVLADLIPWAAPGSKATPLQRAFIRDLILRMEPAAYISLCRVLGSAWRSLPKYEDVRCPLLVIAGAEDKIPTVKMCETIMSSTSSPRKDLKTLDGVGHWIAIEAPDDMSNAIRDFMGDIQKTLPRT